MRENETSNKAKFTVFLSNSGRVVFESQVPSFC